MNGMLLEMPVGPLSVIGRTALVGALEYVSLVRVLRIFGKRTLSKLNALDGTGRRLSWNEETTSAPCG